MVGKQIKRVLVVDDESNIINAIQRELNSPPFVTYRYEVEGFTDPRRALERAREQAFDAVISDYRMPDMDGLEFLTALAKIQPECARIVLSGQTDMDGLIRMINESRIYRFIPKPWHAYKLKTSLCQALDHSAALLEHQRLAALVRGNDILALAIPEREVEQLLIVDDDPGVLNSLARVLTHRSKIDHVLASIRTEGAQATNAVLQEDLISVQVAPSPYHALKIAASADFACVITDYQMPEMNGIEFLKKFSALQPDCMSLLFSSDISKEDLIDAVESANIFAFIDQPWTDFELKVQVALALSRRRILRENRKLAELVSNSKPLN